MNESNRPPHLESNIESNNSSSNADMPISNFDTNLQACNESFTPLESHVSNTLTTAVSDSIPDGIKRKDS